MPLLALLSAILLTAPVSLLALVARAQAEPPLAPGPQDRVLFVPHFGRPSVGDGATGVLSEQFGLTFQNAGSQATELMAIYFAAPPGEDGRDCATCRALGRACLIAPIAPGAAFTFPQGDLAWLLTQTQTEGMTTTWHGSVVLYSLNARPVGEYGPGWVALAQRYAMGPDASFGDFMCQAVFLGRGQRAIHTAQPSVVRFSAAPADDECEWYRAFHQAYLSNDPDALWHGLPIAPVRGEPIAAVAAIPGTTTRPGDVVLDRYDAVTLDETGESTRPDQPVRAAALGAGGAPTPTVHTYVVPGADLAAPDGMNSELTVQNGGVECATVQVEAFRTNQGPLGDPQTLTVPVGAAGVLDLGEHWPAAGSGAVRVTSDQPLALALRTAGFGTSSIHTGLRERSGEVVWAIPLAYQERQRVPRLARADQAVSSEGWETNIAVFNPLNSQRPVTMFQQAAGKPPRPPVGYPMEPRTQVVFQPGFGLGLPGGPGWARFTSDPPPMFVAIESLREASDAMRFVEAWSTRAWPHEPGTPPPRTIALPDLGGPALGDLGAITPVTTTATMTDALVGRIAVQNVATTTARIAVDGFAGCGYGGALERTIDPLQSEIVKVSELPATRYGANQAVIRVLEGDVAVLTEIARPTETTWADAPQDLTSAYLGVPFRDPFPVPTVPTATLAVTPTEILVELPETEVPPVRILNSALTKGCFSYSASVDAGWLTVEPAIGVIPGQLRLSLDPSALGPGSEQVATITIKANEPSVIGSPQWVRVIVRRGEPTRSTIFLPSAQNGEVIEP